MKTTIEYTEHETINQLGKEYSLEKHIAIIKNFKGECAICGPSCNCIEFYSIWFEDNDQRKTIILDWIQFNDLVEGCFVKEGRTIKNYDTLPLLCRQYNECIEWAEFESVDGEVLDGDVLKEFLDYANNVKGLDKEIIEKLTEFLDYTEKNYFEIKISYS